jgi:hypothetical protein
VRRVELTRCRVDEDALLRKRARQEDVPVVFSEPGVYCLDGEPAIIYGRLGGRYDAMRWAVTSIRYQTEVRTEPGGALQNQRRRKKQAASFGGGSRIFGFRPPIAYNPQGSIPALASLSRWFPQQHAVICEFGQLLAGIYREFAPETFERHAKAISGIRSEYLIPGTPFTSGIVNQNNPLGYHYDRGNFEGVMSCMVVFRDLVEGGTLNVPALGAGFSLDDGAFLLFDGQRWLHGVTPIKRLTSKAYRYSVVYYALRAMERCGSAEEELRKARRARVGVERRRRSEDKKNPPSEPDGGPGES